ncbi:hypothetical protein DL96DRAFT_1825886 [Flagelloscypha sp. PMI_526]|nr:hypothetical protein DL96DRAFT_1825886 [Flagelloscypha sp. PMI_526]
MQLQFSTLIALAAAGFPFCSATPTKGISFENYSLGEAPLNGTKSDSLSPRDDSLFTVWTAAGYSGDTYTRWNDGLPTACQNMWNPFDNSISSLVVQSVAQCIFFYNYNCDYNGGYIAARGYSYIQDLNALDGGHGAYNDKISSIQCWANGA